MELKGSHHSCFLSLNFFYSVEGLSSCGYFILFFLWFCDFGDGRRLKNNNLPQSSKDDNKKDLGKKLKLLLLFDN